MILGLNHLREWIAPGFKDFKHPANDAEEFFLLIFDNSDWKIINEICNQTKHVNPVPRLSAEYDLTFESWHSVDDVRTFDSGPPTRFTVDGHDIEPILERVSDFYRRHWFQLHP